MMDTKSITLSISREHLNRHQFQQVSIVTEEEKEQQPQTKTEIVTILYHLIDTSLQGVRS